MFPEDALVRALPRLWSGHAPGFRLVTDFPRHPSREQWRLYRCRLGACGTGKSLSTVVADRGVAVLTRAPSVATRRGARDSWLVFALVFAAELAFGLWMNSRGVHPNDATSRASLALTALYGSDPHLSAIGFLWMPLRRSSSSGRPRSSRTGRAS